MSKVNVLSGYETIPPLAHDYPLKIRKYRGSEKLVPHWHEHLELIYIIDGSCSFIISGKQYDATVGDIVMVNGSEVHSYTSENTPEYYCLLLYPSFFRDVDFSGVMIQNLIRGDETAHSCIEELINEEKKSGAASEMMQKSLAYRLIAHLIESYPRERLSEKDQAQRGVALKRLDKVFDLIAESYAKRISTKDLAAACFLSEGHFCRFFKSATGKSAIEYISEYRVERAVTLLEKTEMPLSEVAESVGFEDVNYFCRVFRRIKGVGPGKFRKSAYEKQRASL